MTPEQRNSPDNSGDEQNQSPEIPKTRRILLIEDHEPFIKAAEFYFPDEGFKIITARTYSEAMGVIRKIDECGVDVILLDQELGNDKFAGNLIMNYINEQQIDVPVIGIASMSSIKGVTRDIGKNAGPDKILEAIRELLADKEQ